MDWAHEWTRFDTDETRRARERMVRKHLQNRDIDDERVLDAMGTVPRHAFVPPARASAAYDDRPLGIGSEQTISQPYMVATMTQLLEPREGARVLEVGTGSGYQTAILALLVAHVYTVERIGALLETAEARFSDLGLENITTTRDDGSEGWFEHAPYDRIIVTASPREVPSLLPGQLSDGGILVIPTGERSEQTLLRIQRSGGRFDRSEHGGCLFVPLYGRHGWGDDSA